MQMFFVYLMVFVLTTRLKAQKPITGCPKVIFNSAQVTDPACDSGIKKVGLSFNKNRVMIKYEDKSKKFYSTDSIWGIRHKNDYPYRLYKGDLYLLYELWPVYKYSKRVGRYGRDYFFSNGLDSALYPYDEKYLRKHTDPDAYAAVVKDAETNRHELAFEFYAVNTRMLNKNLWGGGMDVKYFPVKKWGTGLSFVAVVGKPTDTFSFSIRKPAVTYSEFGWVNQYDVINKGKVRANINLVNGLALVELRDNGEKIRTQTRYGYKNVAKLLARNYYYLLEPGLDISYKVFSNKHYPDFYLTGRIKYRQVFGNSKFASENMFSGPFAGIGLSLIGFNKIQFSK
ncbi:MAG: hypothetical protein K2X86_16840 [Cytophagaceae bacterium]|nr:hypothetical protein [Cytophagaceae bacterium]